MSRWTRLPARGAVSRVARIVPSVLRSADGPPAQVVDWNDAPRRSRRVVT